MLTLKRKLSAWHQLGRQEKALFLEAFFFLTFAKIIVWLVPFKYIAPRLGIPNKEIGSLSIASQDTVHFNSVQIDNARQIANAIRLAVRYTPWSIVCLPQALAAHKMLSNRKLSSTLFLGLAKDENNAKGLKAHSWLQHGDIIICGAKGHQQFTVVSTFSW